MRSVQDTRAGRGRTGGPTGVDVNLGSGMAAAWGRMGDGRGREALRPDRNISRLRRCSPTEFMMHRLDSGRGLERGRYSCPSPHLGCGGSQRV